MWDNDYSEDRFNICRDCPMLKLGKFCVKCGCVMPIKVKLKNAKCPIGKW